MSQVCLWLILSKPIIIPQTVALPNPKPPCLCTTISSFHHSSIRDWSSILLCKFPHTRIFVDKILQPHVPSSSAPSHHHTTSRNIPKQNLQMDSSSHLQNHPTKKTKNYLTSPDSRTHCHYHSHTNLHSIFIFTISQCHLLTVHRRFFTAFD